MTQTQKTIGIVLTVVALIATMYLAVALGTFRANRAEASPITAQHIDAATTTAATSITTSTRIMATTTNPLDPTNSFSRVYAEICNPNSNPVWINMDNDKAANLSTGAITTVIAAAAGYSACYEIKDINQYNGSVTASSTNQSATTITVKQYVQ